MYRVHSFQCLKLRQLCVGVSPDVRVVHEGDNQLEILRSARPWDIRADVQVSLGNQVIFQVRLR